MQKRILQALTITVCLFLSSIAQAQKITATAKIKLETGDPAESVSILVKGTKQGTTTNGSGVFSITVNPTDVLAITFVGYKHLEYPASRLPATIYLQPAVADLNDFVVIGYESKRKRDLTTSVTKVDTKNNIEGGYANFQQLIGGRAAGVQVMENSAEPGGGISIEIRGINSISYSTQPLYVIDGIPFNMPETNLSNGATGLASSSTSNPLSMLNPDDIESIEILKDAAATAIYGSRGSNGVVLITTKTGKVGKIRVTLNANRSGSAPSKNVKVLGARDYATYVNEAWAYRKAIGFNTTAIQPYLPSEIDSLKSYDHQRELEQVAPATDIYTSISGGDAKNKVFVSGQYYFLDGIIPGSSMKRYNGKITYEGKLHPDVTFTASANITNSVRNGQPNGTLSNKVLGWAPSSPLINPDGNLNYLSTYQYGYGQATMADVARGRIIYYNPRFDAATVRGLAATNHPLEYDGDKGVKNVYTASQLLANFGLNWNVSREFTVSTKLGITSFNNLLENYTPNTYINSASTLKGAASTGTSQNNGLLYQVQANYNKRLGKDHFLSAFAVASAEKFVSKSQTASTQGFTSNITSYNSLQSGSSPGIPYSSYNGNQLVSGIVSTSYNYKSTYYLSASGRVDGTSKFIGNERYGIFPALSAAWRMNQEKWFAPLRSVISDLKWRASWGIVGNQSIPSYSTIGTLSVASVVFGNTLNIGVAPTGLPNPMLVWERSKSINLGADMGFFNDRVSLTAEVYSKKTDGLLFSTTPPLTSGYTSLTKNVASLSNEGIEFSAGVKVINTKDVKWNIDANIGFNRNRIDQLSGGNGEYLDVNQVGGSAYLFRVQPGQPIGQFYGLKTIGVWTDETINKKPADFQPGVKEGARRYADLNNDGLLNDADRTYLGSALPKFFGGFSSSIAYKNFELSTFFSYSVGNKIFNYYEIYNSGSYGGLANFRKDLFDQRYRMITPDMNEKEVEQVRKNNNVTKVQVSGTILNPRESTDYYLEDGTYLRCRDITLSWTMPASIIKRLNLAGVKCYANFQNMFTLTSYSGYNPEVNTGTGLSRGVDGGTTPITRSVRLGINVNF